MTTERSTHPASLWQRLRHQLGWGRAWGALRWIEAGFPLPIRFNERIGDGALIELFQCPNFGYGSGATPSRFFRFPIPITGGACIGCITVPDAPEYISPLYEVVPLQLPAYFMATEGHIDVDSPRNLVKARRPGVETFRSERNAHMESATKLNVVI